MPGGRRGLVAPQNTFLDTLMKREQGLPDTSFILANAQIVDFPVVFCSDAFSRTVGFNKADVMQSPATCDFMAGALTDRDTLKSLRECLGSLSRGSFELLCYKKSGAAIWLQIDVTPIHNEQGVSVLVLMAFRDITAFKEPLESTRMMSNLSKFAKLAWTMTRPRNTNANAEDSNVDNVASKLSAPLFRPSEFGRSALHEALPEFKHTPPKTPPHILLHYSPFKVVWDWIILALTFYTVVMVPYNLAINRTFSNEDVSLLVLDLIVDFVFVIDIVFNFHTSFVAPDGAVIVEERKIRRNYFRSGFLIDIMACLPYDAFNMFDAIFRPEAGHTTSSAYGNVFSILKVMRLFRLGRVARAMHRFLESSLALLMLMLSFYMIVAHWFACVWYVIGREDLKSGHTHGWLSQLANNTGHHFSLVTLEENEFGGNYTDIAGGPPTRSMYLTALYFTMTCMTSIGFGNVAAETDSEKAFCVLMMIISSLLYAAIFGHVTTIIHNTTQATAKYHEMLNSVKEFMVLNSVPKTLCERVLDYVVSKWVNTKGVDQDKVLRICPKDMRADICVHLNRNVFNNCQAFRLASDGCLRALAVSFEMIHSAPGDFIVRKGEEIREMCFVVSGSLEVIQDGEIMAFLTEGDVFGDAGWRENTLAKSTVHVRALTYCDIHLINVERLKDVLEFYKAFAQTFGRNLRLTYDLSRRLVFYRASEKKLEKVLKEVQKYEPPFTPAQILLLKRAVNKFKSQVTDGMSSNSDKLLRSASPTTLRDQLITRINSANNKASDKAINEIENLDCAAALPRSRSNTGVASESRKWRLMRQKSQQMFSTAAANNNSSSSNNNNLGNNNNVGNNGNLGNNLSTNLSSNSANKVESNTSALMHDFNLSLSEYRTEMRNNMAHLEEKMGRLEAVILSLVEKVENVSENKEHKKEP